MNGNGPLSFNAEVNDVNFRQTLDAMERRIQGVASTTVQASNTIDKQFSRLGQLAAGYFSFQALSQLPAQILKVRGEFQQLEIAFTTMLRSKTKADALLADLVQTAATTPFGLKDIASGAKQLLAYGSSAGSVVNEIRTLGDVAAGTAVPINDLTYLYGTLRSQGRAYAVDIRQFAGRGIPIYAELAKVLGVSVDKVNDFVSAGKVGFKEVEQAFKNMTTEGGLFQGTLDAQSKSLIGLKERLSDAFDIALNDIGKANEGIITGVISTAADAVTHYQDIIDILKVVAVTYGTYKAAILLVSVVERGRLILLQSIALEQGLAALAGEVLTAQQARQIVVSKLLQQAQASLNATMLANPYVLVATAIAALITAYFVLGDEVTKVKSAQELLAEGNKGVSTELRTQGSEVKTLIGVLQNQNVAESERLKAYDKLVTISPRVVQGLDFQAAKTADLTRATNEYLASLKQKIRLEAAQNGLKAAYEQEQTAIENLKKAQDSLVKTSATNQNRASQGLAAGSLASTLSVQQSDAAARSRLEQATKARKEAALATKELETNVGAIYSGGSKDALNSEIRRLETAAATVKDKLSPAYKQIEDDLKTATAQRDALTQAEKKGGAVVAKTTEYYDAQIKSLKEQQSANATNRAEYTRFQKEIEAAEAAKRRITGELTKDQKKAATDAKKDADKTGPLGSIAYYETISGKAQKVIDKTSSTDTGTLTKQYQIKADADKAAETIRKQYAIKSFNEELDEKKTQYDNYNKFIEAYGQEFANAQFQTLRAGAASYVDYLTAQIEVIKNSSKTGTLDTAGIEKLAKLTDAKAEATGGKTRIELFRESLQKAGTESETLTQYLQKLVQVQNSIDPLDNSTLGLQKRKEIAEQILATENERKGRLVEFLSSVEGSEAKRLLITRRYADLRAQVEKEFAGKVKGSVYIQANVDISKKEAAELNALKIEQSEASEAFRELNKTIDVTGRDALKVRLQRLKDYLVELEKTVGKESEIYRATQKEIKDTSLSIDTDTLNSYRTFAKLGGELAGQLVTVNGGLGLSAKLIQGLASGADNLAVTFDKSASKTDKIAAGVNGLVSLVNIVVSSAQQRKQAEEAYYNSVIAQQQQYNIALNDQIGIQAELSSNVFITDYAAKLSADYKQLTDAQNKYQESLSKLNNGKAKTGQRDGVDFGAIGQAAAAGAAIGSIIPGLGTVIGAVGGAIVGGLVGLFGGKKKEDVFGSLLSEYPELIQRSSSGVDDLNVELAKTLVAQGLVDDQTKQLLQSTIDWTEQIKKAQEAIKQVIGQLAGQLGNSLRDNLVNAFKDGTDSAIAFGDSVSKVLEDVLSNLIFNQVFAKQFDALQADLEASAGPNGDGTWIDDFGKFFGKADELTKLFNDGLQQAQNAAGQYGLNVFAKKNTGSQPNANSLSGAIKGVTEETASVLAGQINAIRITQADTNGQIRQTVLLLSNISLNSNYLPLLDSIDRGIKAIADDPLRAKGGLGPK